MNEKEQNVPGNTGRMIRIDEAEGENLLDRKVRESFEETLNGKRSADGHFRLDHRGSLATLAADESGRPEVFPS